MDHELAEIFVKAFNTSGVIFGEDGGAVPIGVSGKGCDGARWVIEVVIRREQRW